MMTSNIQEFSDKWDDMELQGRCDEIPRLRAEECCGKDKQRLAIVLDRLEPATGSVLKQVLTLLGGERKEGRAPASAFEDQFEAWLDSLGKLKT